MPSQYSTRSCWNPTRWRRAVSIAVSLLIFNGCSEGNGNQVLMPDLVGQRLDVALSNLERAGIAADAEVVGGGMFGVVDESNWLVCEQSPAVGVTVSDVPRLTVDRTCPEISAVENSELGEVEAESSSTTPSSATSSSTESEPQDRLTALNSKDFAEVLSAPDPDNQLLAAFADNYKGRIVEFNAHIADLAKHGDQKTRFDILILAGDFNSPEVLGPYFQFRDVNLVNDLNLVGSKTPDYLGRGDNLRVVARVVEFEPNSGLLLLDPVETEIR